MKHLALALVASFVIAAGCGTVPTQSRAHQFMSESLSELEDGDMTEAKELLSDARNEDSSFDTYQEELDIIEAEILFAEGEYDQASTLMNGILAENPDSPLANEIAAKCLIRAGSFLSAETHLLAALEKHPRESDRARVQDLLNLVWGLTAYSSGRKAEASSIWQGIKCDELRESVDAIVGSYSKLKVKE